MFRLAKLISLFLVVGAMFAAVANADSWWQSTTTTTPSAAAVYQGYLDGRYGQAGQQIVSQEAAQTTSPATASAAPSGDGFAWTDFGIGIASALAALGLVTFVISRTVRKPALSA